MLRLIHDFLLTSEQQIPGIAAVGPQMKPVLSIGFEVSTKLDFVYGFDVAVCSESFIHVLMTIDKRFKGQRLIKIHRFPINPTS